MQQGTKFAWYLKYKQVVVYGSNNHSVNYICLYELGRKVKKKVTKLIFIPEFPWKYLGIIVSLVCMTSLSNYLIWAPLNIKHLFSR